MSNKYNCCNSIFDRNRLPNHFDDLSYWSDVFLWREHHFKCIVKAFDGSAHHGDQVCWECCFIILLSLCVCTE